MLPFSLINNSTQDFAVLNVICSYVGIMAAPAIYIQTPFMFTRYFYSLCNPVAFCSAYTFILHWKTGFKDI
jgi:hypothetical protein